MNNVLHERLTTLNNLWMFRWELWRATRPLTMLYAFCWTNVGYAMYPTITLHITLLCAFTMALSTGSIMLYNDHADRERDKKDSKPFASQHPNELKLCWKLLCGFIALLMVVLVSWNLRAALFCAVIWMAGTLYSWIPHWFIVQNLVVAACSASPVLCGSIATGQWNQRCLSISAILFGFVAISEIVKDFEDMPHDLGYKATLPLYSPRMAIRIVTAIISITLAFVWHAFGWMATLVIAVPLSWINGDLNVLFLKQTGLPDQETIQDANELMDRTILIFFLVVIIQW